MEWYPVGLARFSARWTSNGRSLGSIECRQIETERAKRFGRYGKAVELRIAPYMVRIS